MENITAVRKTVASMANQLYKLGYSLSKAFKMAWRRVKQGMTIKVSGVTYQNRQQLLQFISGRNPEELTVYLKKDRANTYDKYAVAVVIGIRNPECGIRSYRLCTGRVSAKPGCCDRERNSFTGKH